MSSAATTRVGPRSGLRRKNVFLSACAPSSPSAARSGAPEGASHAADSLPRIHAVLTLVAALCAARSASGSSRGETARDRKFGRPRTGLARARRGVDQTL